MSMPAVALAGAGVLHSIFAPGFFTSSAVMAALVIGAVVALVSAPTGVLTVMRSQSFAGHAFSEVTATGGSAAYLAGVAPLLGYVVGSLVGAGAMGGLGVQRARNRDLVAGIVLGAALGLTALLLYLTTVSHSTTGAAVTVLFGSLFSLSSGDWLAAVALGGTVLSVVAVAWRPLLLSSVSPELAAARGVHLRLLETAYLASVALSVALAAMTVGAILSTALLIGPAAAALRLARSPGRACAWASAIGLAAVWGGILLAYDSYDWPPAHQGWPVSFFVVLLVLAIYVAAQLFGRAGPRRGVGSGHSGTAADQAGNPRQPAGSSYAGTFHVSRTRGRAGLTVTSTPPGAARARGRRSQPGRG